MKLIVGLGNPGKKYQNTRHNTGFNVVDELAQKHGAKLKNKILRKAQATNISLFNENITLLKPQTFMNLSGGCVQSFFRKAGFKIEDVLIVCDDANLPFGKIRIRPSGSAGGHNGLTSIIKSLGSDAFPRLRIGISANEHAKELSDFVLSTFSKKEQGAMKQIIETAVSVCESWISNGVETVMREYN